MALSAKSKETLRRWLEGDHTWYWRTYMWAGAFWHNKVPRRLRPWGIFHLVARAALICAAPITGVITSALTVSNAIVVAVVLLLFNVATTVGDRLSKEKARSPEFAGTGLVRVGDLLSSYKPDAVRGRQYKETAIEACLGIMESIALPVTKSQTGDVSVTLILYEGSSVTKMRVRKRNPGNTRPLNRPVDTERTLGHYVCQRGDSPLTINDIKHFGKEFAQSPTQTSYDYKAILLIPLLCDTQDGPKPKGFVSIDCNRPYAFYGNRANSITVMSKPILAQLREMI